MRYYRDLREHIAALEKNNKLTRIKRPVVKETELMPLVRWQFRGLPEEMRKAFLFENVIDIKGKKYPIPVLVASHAASSQVYAIGMMCRPEEIADRIVRAGGNLIEPKLVDSGPVHEVIHLGDKLLEHGGLDELPVPISTPGFDNAPYLSSAFWISKDPDTGTRNVGCYRAMVKSRTRLGIFRQEGQHLGMQWKKCQSKGIPLQAAIVIGTSPNIGYASVARLPYGVDELGFAGAIAGEPVELVKCKTVDIEVPATAEIVIEGTLPVDSMEREGPFGEYNGYMGMDAIGPYLNVTCITHRTNPIYNAFISQFPPSESSKMREVSEGPLIYRFLKYDCNIPSVLEVVQHESVGSSLYCVIRMKKQHPAQVWQALNLVVGRFPGTPKYVIAVDEDIDPKDPDSVNWALCWRVQPHRDIRIVQGKSVLQDPSGQLPDQREEYPLPSGGSALLIDATMNWGFPPVSLPAKEFMERAKAIWEEENLPELNPKTPWFGYSLGCWTEELEKEAELALKGEHYRTGEKMARTRKQI